MPTTLASSLFTGTDGAAWPSLDVSGGTWTHTKHAGTGGTASRTIFSNQGYSNNSPGNLYTNIVQHAAGGTTSQNSQIYCDAIRSDSLYVSPGLFLRGTGVASGTADYIYCYLPSNNNGTKSDTGDDQYGMTIGVRKNGGEVTLASLYTSYDGTGLVTDLRMKMRAINVGTRIWICAKAWEQTGAEPDWPAYSEAAVSVAVAGPDYSWVIGIIHDPATTEPALLNAGRGGLYTRTDSNPSNHGLYVLYDNFVWESVAVSAQAVTATQPSTLSQRRGTSKTIAFSQSETATALSSSALYRTIETVVSAQSSIARSVGKTALFSQPTILSLLSDTPFTSHSLASSSLSISKHIAKAFPITQSMLANIATFTGVPSQIYVTSSDSYSSAVSGSDALSSSVSLTDTLTVGVAPSDS